jgi:hypothetical protein
MPLDTSIALQAKAPEFNPLQQALQVAQYRAYNANGLAAQQKLDANNAASQAFKASTDANGNTDYNKFRSIMAGGAGAYNLPEINQQITQQQQAQQNLEKGGVELNNAQRENFAKSMQFMTQQFATVDPNDPKAQGKFLQIAGDAINQGHVNPAMVKATVAQMPDDPSQFKPWFQQKLASFQDVGAQLKSTTPTPTQIDNGGSIQYKDTNPITNPGIIGTNITKTLDPGTATSPVSVYDPKTGTNGIAPRGSLPGFGGADSPPPLPSVAMPANMPTGNGQAAPMPSGPAPGAPRGFVPTGPAMGVAGSNDGNVDVVNKHWATVGADAQNAQTNIGIAQNIKSYADKALTGKQGDKLAAVNGLLSVFGQGGQTDISTATDLLQKNMARLSLTSRQGAGGTDAAGALATAANPHGTMTAEAIKDAADQVIGAQKMALSQQQLLQPFKLNNDVAGYQATLSKFNQAADPRVWQFQDMTPDQRAHFKAGLSPADQKAFSSKIRTLEGMGAIK